MKLKALLFRPRVKEVIVLIVTLELIVLTISLGMWQWSRAKEKWALEEQIEKMQALSALTEEQYLALHDPLEALQRKVVLRGHWLGQETIYLDNRAMNAQAGFWVMTPLALNAQDSVLVQRGWIPRNTHDRNEMSPFETPSGEVQIEARITAGPSRMFDFGASQPQAFKSLDEARSLKIRQNVELKAFAQERALHLLGHVMQIGPDSQGLRRDWPVAASTAYKNVGYTVQWFALSLLIALLYIWYQIIQPKRDAKRNLPTKD